MDSLPLTKSEVADIKPEDVHNLLARKMLVDGFHLIYDLDKSHDCYLHVAKTGQELLDFYSFFASWPLTHNHPKMKDPKFLEQLARVASVNPANADVYTVEMAQFVTTFERVAVPKIFKYLFFISGGSLAVENALKTSFDWKVRKNIAAGHGPRGQKVIHFREAFHGRSGYTLSLTNTNDPNKYLYFPMFDWPRIENPKATFPLEGENLQNTIESETRVLTQIRHLLEKEHLDVACIIIEPIQSEGGDNHFRSEFLLGLRKLADEFDVLLVFDEVQSGMGITGKFWAFEHLGVTPDILCFGKKAQICGIMVTDRIDIVSQNVFQVPSRINSTWGGNLTDMYRSRRLLEIVEEENLVENARVVGEYLLHRLHELQAKFPNHMTNARGRGLLCAFDVPSAEHCKLMKDIGHDKSVMLLSCGAKTIRLRPVLNVKKGDIDELMRILPEIFHAIEEKGIAL